jgi:LysM repeat protein/ABC-type branched-subunit amino acid transport system substrate-binding protein
MGLMFMVSLPCSAQDNVNNERSKIVEKFYGKPFYIHFVKEGQTLYSISKLYNVTSEILIADNPDLRNGLKTEMIIKIPCTDTIVGEEKPKTAPFIIKKDASTVSQPVKYNSYIVYEIKRSETLYGIAKRYNVSMDDILNANPGITSFKSGTKIRIPASKAENVQATAPSKPIKSNGSSSRDIDSKASNTKSLAVSTINSDSPAKSLSKQYKVALLIPFYLDEIDSIRVDQKDPKSFAFVQFYEASLLAVDSLKKQGLDVELFVYDTGGDEGVDKTKTIFQKRELADMDLIIGPFYAKCFEIASRYAGLHKIPIVNPLSKRNEIITGKPWVFKVQPTGTGQMSELAGFINQHFANSNVILVRSDKLKMAVEAAAFKAEMLLNFKKQSRLNNFKESFFTAEGISGLTLRLSNDKPNILVVLSTDEVFVSGILRKLVEKGGNYDLTVMGMASWEQFKLDIKAMIQLKMHLCSNKIVDFSDGSVQQFSSAFQKEYKTVPEVKKYGFDGFDITYYFLSALLKYGRQFEKHIDDYPYQGLQNSFHYHKNEGGGYENTGVNFYRFEENKLKRVL